MPDSISDNLTRLGITIPTVAAPAANYVPFIRTGSLIMTSGQLPFVDGKIVKAGKVGSEVTLSEAQDAARACALNILAVASFALDGDLERIERLVKLTGFVASSPEFTEQHLVVNGASDFLVEALGDRGRHARSAVGMASLPFGAPVEIEAILSVR